MERRWGASALPSTFSGPPSGKREAASVRLKPVSRRPQYYDDVLHAAHGCAPLATGRRSPCFSSLRPGEYLTIHGDIVVQLAQLSGSRAFLRVEADRSIPIVRGKVLERSGAPRPECLASLPAAAPGKAGMPSTTGVRSGSGPSVQWNSSWSGWRPGTAGRKPRRCGHSWSTCFQLYGRRSCPAKYRPCSAAKQPRTYKEPP